MGHEIKEPRKDRLCMAKTVQWKRMPFELSNATASHVSTLLAHAFTKETEKIRKLGYMLN